MLLRVEGHRHRWQFQTHYSKLNMKGVEIEYHHIPTNGLPSLAVEKKTMRTKLKVIIRNDKIKYLKKSPILKP